MNKNINAAKNALRIGVLSLGALSALAPTAFADDNDRREERREEKSAKRDVQKARRDVKRERRDVQTADTAAERRREQREAEAARENLRREREELRREKNDDSYTFRNGNRNNGNNGRFNRPANRPTYNNGYSYGTNNNYGYSTTGGQRVTGTVTRVRSSQSFDIRVGSSTFNVYTTRALPRALSAGDVVRVSGERVGGNDIRNAGFSIVTNR